MEIRLCKICSREKEISLFEKIPSGYRKICTACRSSLKRKNNRSRNNKENSKWRKTHPASAIFSDSKSYDKKRGLEGFDLSSNIINEIIKDGCSYCGETSIRIR